MGTAEGYLCEVCRHEFTATEATVVVRRGI